MLASFRSHRGIRLLDQAVTDEFHWNCGRQAGEIRCWRPIRVARVRPPERDYERDHSLLLSSTGPFGK